MSSLGGPSEGQGPSKGRGQNPGGENPGTEKGGRRNLARENPSREKRGREKGGGEQQTDQVIEKKIEGKGDLENIELKVTDRMIRIKVSLKNGGRITLQGTLTEDFIIDYIHGMLQTLVKHDPTCQIKGKDRFDRCVTNIDAIRWLIGRGSPRMLEWPKGSILEGFKIEGFKLQRAEFDSVDLRDVELDGVEVYLNGVNVHGGAKLTNCKITMTGRCAIKGHKRTPVELENSQVGIVGNAKAIIKHAILKGTRFMGQKAGLKVVVGGVDLSGTDVRDVYPKMPFGLRLITAISNSRWRRYTFGLLFRTPLVGTMLACLTYGLLLKGMKWDENTVFYGSEEVNREIKDLLDRVSVRSGGSLTVNGPGVAADKVRTLAGGGPS